jgi:hypothetical protein
MLLVLMPLTGLVDDEDGLPPPQDPKPERQPLPQYDGVEPHHPYSEQQSPQTDPRHVLLKSLPQRALWLTGRCGEEPPHPPWEFSGGDLGCDLSGGDSQDHSTGFERVKGSRVEMVRMERIAILMS